MAGTINEPVEVVPCAACGDAARAGLARTDGLPVLCEDCEGIRCDACGLVARPGVRWDERTWLCRDCAKDAADEGRYLRAASRGVGGME